jgi:hypothetical protein
MYKKIFWILALLLISSILLASCAQPTEANPLKSKRLKRPHPQNRFRCRSGTWNNPHTGLNDSSS